MPNAAFDNHNELARSASAGVVDPTRPSDGGLMGRIYDRSKLRERPEVIETTSQRGEPKS